MTNKTFIGEPATGTTSQLVKLVVVSDFFKEDYIGGAELTLDAILQKCPVRYSKIRSQSVTLEFIERNKDKTWLLVNYSAVPKDAIIEIATTCKFYVIECDYKYCVFRSSHLHNVARPETPCECQHIESGRFTQGLFKRALGVSFMSQGQMNEYKRLFPAMAAWPEGKLRVQGSTFDDATLETLDKLSQRPKNGLHAVLGGGSWIKNLEATEKLLRARGIDFDVIGGLAPDKFLEKLSSYKTLVFHPAGFDTAPRLTIEAKLLGLELDLNEKVQHQYEPWFTGSREKMIEHLKTQAERFWKEGLVIA